jgi:methyltransferase-like protein/2-polyprenyl-3-methyl-5-hydroxy-6-metoxy-1,4-benzoquinol methylase
MTTATSYDEVPYGSHAFAQSHPDRLAVIARLFGMSPAPINQCRVLELGCASGGNLIPMAFHLPESEFVGADLSARQVEDGRKTIQELGLKNIRIENASIADVDASYGTFDYIICHGVYSWVPAEIRDRILAVSSANLSPQGIAYISYNTYPGWHMREMLRHMMLYHIRHLKDSTARVDQAKALIDFLASHVPAENNAYGLFLKNELALINRVDDWYLFHDHLEEVNQPVYFHQFMEQAAGHGLKYLGESEIGTMMLSRLPKEVADTLRQGSKNIVVTEQYMDFFRNRSFRQTLLCHSNVPVKRNIGPEDVRNFLIASAIRPENGPADFSPEVSQSFRTPRGLTIKTNRPLIKAALTVLRENWPRAVDLDTLFNASVQKLKDANHLKEEPSIQQLALDLLNGYTSNIVLFRSWEGEFASKPGERPKISALAAHYTKQGKPLVNLHHEQIGTDPLMSHIIGSLDGTQNRADIVNKLSELIKNGTLSAQQDNQPVSDPAAIRTELERDVERRLLYLAESALLTE